MTAGRARRRFLTGAAAIGFGMMGLVRGATAQDAVPVAYAGSHSTTPGSTSSSSFSITAEWHRVGKLTVQTWATPPAGFPAGCPAPTEIPLPTTTTDDGAANTPPKVTLSTAAAQTPCNGTYAYRINATYGNGLFTVDQATLRGAIDVAVAPANVTGVQAKAGSGGDNVVITWSLADSPAPDFQGYTVQRKNADGSWSTLDAVAPDQDGYTDSTPPASGGAVTYRVLARRAGPGGSSVYSAGGGTATATLPVSTTATTTATGGGGAGGGGTGGTGGGTGGRGGTGGPGGTAGATGGTGGTGSSIGARGALNKGNTGIGTTAPRVGDPASTNFPQLGVAEGDPSDPGYNAKLNYGKQSALAEGDGLSSANYEQGGGRGMAIPVATGFVLAAWAFHLRFLAKAAKPAGAVAPRHRPT